MKFTFSLLTQSFRRTKGSLQAFWMSVLLTTVLPFSNGQSEQLNDKTRTAIETISKYADSGFDRLSPQFEQIGYIPPEHLKSDWQRWPTGRRVEMAYREYEYLVPGEGDKFLALMSQNLAQIYDPIYLEAVLKPYLIPDENLPKMLSCNRNLINLQDYEQVIRTFDTSPEVKSAIETISLYTESGALGGTHYLLAEFCKQKDAEIFEILGNSKSSKEALIEGVHRASSVQSADEIVRQMTEYVCYHYEGAREEPTLKDWKTDLAKTFSGNSVKKEILPIDDLGGGHNIGGINFPLNFKTTMRMVELVPDESSNSIQVIINPAYINRIPSNFCQKFGEKLQGLFDLDASFKHRTTFEKEALEIETEMRHFLKNTHTKELRTPTGIRNSKLGEH